MSSSCFSSFFQFVLEFSNMYNWKLLNRLKRFFDCTFQCATRQNWGNLNFKFCQLFEIVLPSNLVFTIEIWFWNKVNYCWLKWWNVRTIDIFWLKKKKTPRSQETKNSSYNSSPRDEFETFLKNPFEMNNNDKKKRKYPGMSF